MLKLAELVPRHPGRKGKGSPPTLLQVVAAAMGSSSAAPGAGPSTSGTAKASSGSAKSAKKKGKK